MYSLNRLDKSLYFAFENRQQILLSDYKGLQLQHC